MGFLFGKKDREPHKLPCRQRKSYLSAPEQALYRVLRLAVGDTFTICPKVNFRDIFYVDQPHRNTDLHNEVERRQITFLLCNIATMNPELGLELDESPPEQHGKSEGDFLVEEIFEAAGMPFVRIYAAPMYNPNDLRERVFEAVSTDDEPDEDAAPFQGYERHGSHTGPDGREKWEEQPDRDNLQPPGDSRGGLAAAEDDPGISTGEEVWRSEESPAAGEDTVSPPVPDAGLPAEESAAAGSGWDRHDAAGDRGMNEEKPSTGSPPERGFLFEPAAGKEPGFQDRQDTGEGGAEEQKEVRSPDGSFLFQLKPHQVVEEEDQDPAVTAPHVDDPDDSDFARPKTATGFGQNRTRPGSFVSQFEQEFNRKMEEAAAEASQKPAPLCPNCQVSMVLRTSKRNIKFYSCTNFPRCKEFKGLLE